METIQQLARPDGGIRSEFSAKWQEPTGDRHALLNPLVAASVVVIVSIFVKRSLELSLSKEQKVIRALTLQRTIQSFNESIGLG